ncbi:hypothetical protein TKK_0002272 [Trichogramma kaykai]
MPTAKALSDRHKRRLAQLDSASSSKQIMQDILQKRNKENPIENNDPQTDGFHFNNTNNDDHNSNEIICPDNAAITKTTKNACLFNYTMNDIVNICDDVDILIDDVLYRYSDSELSDLELDSFSDDENTIKKNNDSEDPFKISIENWVLDYKIPHNATQNLLKILNDHTSSTFPKDSSTFLKTPRNLNILTMKNGEYHHFGLKESIQRIIDKLESMKKLKEKRIFVKFFYFN